MITDEGKNKFLKKLCLNLKGGILFVFLVPYVEVPVGIILTGKEAVYLKKNYNRNTTFYNSDGIEWIPNLIPSKAFL